MVPLTKVVTKSTFVQRLRSNHIFESIGSIAIMTQSSISPISSFTGRSFNRLNHSYCFIDPFSPQKYEIEKRPKFTKAHKVPDAFYLFYFILIILFYFTKFTKTHILFYFISAMISYILIVPIGMSSGVINYTSGVKQ